ncbi:MAG TPA: hypothetical protein VHC67_18045 [Gaiellaceae bacterium]|jgi:hypothetical protein|nr:hypothetical protein [Gaiellaceae bacterium]
MRLAALLLLVPLLAACGGEKPDSYAQANVALLDRLPVYPQAASPRTSSSGVSNTELGARDWTLPADAKAAAVLKWYERALPQRGWTIANEGNDAIRAARGDATLSLGVRGRTLEAVVNSRAG